MIVAASPDAGEYVVVLAPAVIGGLIGYATYVAGKKRDLRTDRLQNRSADTEAFQAINEAQRAMLSDLQRRIEELSAEVASMHVQLEAERERRRNDAVAAREREETVRREFAVFQQTSFTQMLELRQELDRLRRGQP